MGLAAADGGSPVVAHVGRWRCNGGHRCDALLLLSGLRVGRRLRDRSVRTGTVHQHRAYLSQQGEAALLLLLLVAGDSPVPVERIVRTVRAEIVRVEGEDHRAAEPVRLDVLRLALEAALVLVRDPLAARVQVGRAALHIVHLVDVDVVPAEPAGLRVRGEAERADPAVAGRRRTDPRVERVDEREGVAVGRQAEYQLAFVQPRRQPVVHGGVDVERAEQGLFVRPPVQRRIKTCAMLKQ